jgi:hypothetical protein
MHLQSRGHAVAKYAHIAAHEQGAFKSSRH